MDLHELISKNSNDEVLNLLLKEKKSNNIEKIINKVDEYGNTPLHLAVSSNNQKIAHLLIKFGASPEIVNARGEEVIWIPIEKKNKHFVTGKRIIKN